MCLCVCLSATAAEGSMKCKSFYWLTYSHVFLDLNSWICKIMLRSRVMASFGYFEGHCSDSCVATSLDIT